jgi:hypothetical protein
MLFLPDQLGEAGGTMKVWITKYALTEGISEHEAELVPDSDNRMIRLLNVQYVTYYRGNEWQDSLESANARVLEMITAKRKSLAKAIAKLDKIEQRIKPHAPAPQTPPAGDSAEETQKLRSLLAIAYLSIQYGESLFLEKLWSRFHTECHKLFATHEDTRAAALAGEKT